MQHSAYSEQYCIISLKFAMLRFMINILTTHTQQNNKGGGRRLWPLMVVMASRCMLTPKLGRVVYIKYAQPSAC
jgi:hypothetical protein